MSFGNTLPATPINNTVAEIVQRIAQAYELKRAGTQ